MEQQEPASEVAHDELDLNTIKERSVGGVAALTMRTLFMQTVNNVSMFVLTILLEPEVFGVFFVVSAVIGFLKYFSDVGLAAALVQKRTKPTRQDLVSTFTLQQILVIVLVIGGLLSSRWLGSFFDLSTKGLWLFRALMISFFLSSLKTIPSVLMERQLDFSRMIIPEIVETVVFNIVAITMAWQGYGVMSFAVAVLARGVTGVLTMYLIYPWRVGLGISRTSLGELFHFGIPFQANSILALVKDELQTVFLGRMLPLAQVGYLGWAQKWAFMPLRLFLDNVSKVTFPSFSRLQDDMERLTAAVNKALFAVSASTFPILIGVAVVAEPLLTVIPRYSKWEPALIPLYFFIFNAMFATFSSTLTNVLNATGRVKLTLKLMVMWTTLTWLSLPPLVIWFGYIGAAVASAIVGTSSIVVIFLARRIVKFSLWQSVVVPLLAAIGMGLGAFVVSRQLEGILSVGGAIAVGVLFYPILLAILSRGKAFDEIRQVYVMVREKRT